MLLLLSGFLFSPSEYSTTLRIELLRKFQTATFYFDEGIILIDREKDGGKMVP